MCRGIATYECLKEPGCASTSYCFPDEVTGCPSGASGDHHLLYCSTAALFGSPKPDETCCAPLGTRGAYACQVADGVTPGCGSCPAIDDPPPMPSCEGGTCGRTLATDVASVPALTTDESNLYWRSRDHGVFALGFTASAPRVLVSDAAWVNALASDGTFLYLGGDFSVANGGKGIVRLPVAGGDVQDFAPTVGSDGRMFVAGDFLYWHTREGRLAFKPLSGGGIESVLGSLDDLSRSAANSASVFVVGSEPLQRPSTWKVPLGGTAHVLVSDSALDHVAVTDDHLYWVSSTNSACGRIYSVVARGLDDGATVVLSRTRRQITDIAVHGGAVYYTTPDGILRVGATGGPVTGVVGTLARNFVIHGSSLYWVDKNDVLYTLGLK